MEGDLRAMYKLHATKITQSHPSSIGHSEPIRDVENTGNGLRKRLPREAFVQNAKAPVANSEHITENFDTPRMNLHQMDRLPPPRASGQNLPFRIEHSALIKDNIDTTRMGYLRHGRLPSPVIYDFISLDPDDYECTSSGSPTETSVTSSDRDDANDEASAVSSRSMRKFQDYMDIVISNFDGGVESFRTPSGYSAASTATGFDDMADGLELTNRLRLFLRSTITPLKLKELGDVMIILRDLEEAQDPKATTFEQLRYTRQDKLVEETLHLKIDDRISFDTQQCGLVFRTFVLHAAKRLQLQWQNKFGESYFTIDKARLDSLAIDGALQGVSLNLGHRANFEDRWNPMPPNLAARQFGDLGFAPGEWWLNVQCAARDGIVETAVDVMTVSVNRDAVYALVLDTGKEVITVGKGITLYTKRGPSEEMLLPCLGQRDRPFRILRKYGLDSPWAPPAGLRYDVSYSWVRVDKNEFQVQVGMKRVENQTSMAVIVNTSPKPSQLDDWVLYNGILTDDYRSRTEPQNVYAARKMCEEEELRDHARTETKQAVHRFNVANAKRA